MEKGISTKLYGTGHALYKTELDPTPKLYMLQSSSAGYTACYDIYFIVYTCITKWYRVAWAIVLHLNSHIEEITAITGDADVVVAEKRPHDQKRNDLHNCVSFQSRYSSCKAVFRRRFLYRIGINVNSLCLFISTL